MFTIGRFVVIYLNGNFKQFCCGCGYVPTTSNESMHNQALNGR